GWIVLPLKGEWAMCSPAVKDLLLLNIMSFAVIVQVDRFSTLLWYPSHPVEAPGGVELVNHMPLTLSLILVEKLLQVDTANFIF
ncbi:MAG: hypothetical protein M3Q07_19350, partial [Pseudobdellovibrionaceae bacterium]|nr:hypothetical protein [Pseudobdellovibrionaceae bacterium]